VPSGEGLEVSKKHPNMPISLTRASTFALEFAAVNSAVATNGYRAACRRSVFFTSSFCGVNDPPKHALSVYGHFRMIQQAELACMAKSAQTSKRTSPIGDLQAGHKRPSFFAFEWLLSRLSEKKKNQGPGF
jgi:hypothetical protein